MQHDEVTRRLNELYAEVFARCYGVDSIGLRYFNVFGPRQDPASEYSAVIPRFITAIKSGARASISARGSA